MSHYFDTTTHIHLIREEFRTLALVDSAILLTDIEQEVIDSYTISLQPGPSWIANQTEYPLSRTWGTDIGAQQYVMLLNYTIDPDACVNPKFKREMARSIAKVANHRLLQTKINPLETNRSAAGGVQLSVAYRDAAVDAFPVGWDGGLVPFVIEGAGHLPIVWGW
jgi:hypothetical protein